MQPSESFHKQEEEDTFGSEKSSESERGVSRSGKLESLSASFSEVMDELEEYDADSFDGQYSDISQKDENRHKSGGSVFLERRQGYRSNSGQVDGSGDLHDIDNTSKTNFRSLESVSTQVHRIEKHKVFIHFAIQVLAALEMEKSKREKADQSISELRKAMEEALAEKEVEIASLQKETVDLKSQMKKLETTKGLPELFETYEAKLSEQSRTIQSLEVEKHVTNNLEAHNRQL